MDSDIKKLSRNDACWCGSGKKYKHCHLNADQKQVGSFRRTADHRKVHPTNKAIPIKTPDQLAGIRRACALVKNTFEMLEDRIKAGITTNQIEKWVIDFTLEHGAVSGTMGYRGFPKSICTSINSVICHGIPDDRPLQNGDIVNVDITSVLRGFYGDASRMYLIGEVNGLARQLVEDTKKCLEIGIEQVRPFNTIGDIGFVIQKYAEDRGYSVVRDYAGHGVGLAFHEEPSVNHYAEQRKTGPIMVPGMTFTIEPMINAGKPECRVLEDNWTAVTADGSLSAQWEHTVLVTDNGVEILTA